MLMRVIADPNNPDYDCFVTPAYAEWLYDVGYFGFDPEANSYKGADGILDGRPLTRREYFTRRKRVV